MSVVGDPRIDYSIDVAVEQADCVTTRIDVLPLSLDECNRLSIAGFGEAVVTPVYWISCNALTAENTQQIADELLVDPIIEIACIATQHGRTNQQKG